MMVVDGDGDSDTDDAAANVCCRHGEYDNNADAYNDDILTRDPTITPLHDIFCRISKCCQYGVHSNAKDVLHELQQQLLQ